MARRGSFGRVPRAAPSLTSTIIAIAREMQAARDRNIMDAWQNGGLFEGKKVSDAMVLKHWRERMKHVDKDDPKWDEYNNQVMQLDYTIHEQKAYTSYMQGKISDQTMAKFYLDWAKKVPRDSQFYRELQQDAARFLEAGKAKGRAAAKKAEEEAYQQGQKTLSGKAETGEFLGWVLEGVAKVNGLVGMNDTKGLGNLSDPENFVGLVERINAHPDEVLFESNGVAWTGNDVLKHLGEIDPGFKAQSATLDSPAARASRENDPLIVSGGLTLDYVKGAWKTQHETYLSQQRLAAETGHKEDSNAFEKAAGTVSGNVRAVGIWGVAPSYNDIIAERDAILNSTFATSEEKAAAALKAAGALANLSRTPGLDLRTAKTLWSEASANNGDPSAAGTLTYGEDYLGTKTRGYSEGGARASTSIDPETGETVTAGANMRISALVQTLAREVDTVYKKPDDFTYTQGTRDPDTGAFSADPAGQEIGVASKAEVAALSPAYATVAVQQGDGSVITVMVAGKPIKSVAYDADGNKIDTARSNGTNVLPLDHSDLGYSFDYMNGGKQVTLYQLPGADGRPIFTTVPPWASNAFETRGKDGAITVDLSNVVDPNALYQSVTGAPGKYVAEEAGPGTTQYYDPVATAIAASTALAGRDESSMFSTPLGATLAVTENPKEAVRSVANSPRLQAELIAQEERFSGGDVGAMADIQAENTNLLAGNVGANLPPKYSLNRAGLDYVKTETTFLGREIPDDGSLAPVKAAVKRLRDARFGEDTGVASLDPGSNPYKKYGTLGAPIQIKTAGQITVPGVPNVWAPGVQKSPAGTPAQERLPKPAPIAVPTPVKAGPSDTGAAGSLLPPETEDKWTIAQRTAKPTTAPRAW